MGKDENTLYLKIANIFFMAIFIVSIISWIVFRYKGMIIEMCISNAFMCISVFGRMIKFNDLPQPPNQ